MNQLPEWQLNAIVNAIKDNTMAIRAHTAVMVELSEKSNWPMCQRCHFRLTLTTDPQTGVPVYVCSRESRGHVAQRECVAEVKP